MKKVLVITPVKNALENTLLTIKAIQASTLPLEYRVYNDFSDEETKLALVNHTKKYPFGLIHLQDITDTPSPNYKLVLQDAQKRALKMGLPLLIVESDVEVKQDTLEKMLNFQEAHSDAGMVGAITVDADGKVNFPYLKFKNVKERNFETKRSLSFCCTLLSLGFLEKYDFLNLDQSKDWYDTHISEVSIKLGFKNYVLMDTPVLHKPHSSRPWKQLKYSNPVKYYWNKIFQGKDKI
ncbi:glycosyltransferase [Pararhodonellum marinum]|uniref:glycosyltransferase n=1 Tax=Pararhodonellum marinum TaxID=2755358 RepID=UPI001890B023|nr:glycosyltransferase [Pararhodonellum marinum]